jgi:hypothetical protein
VLHMNIAEVDWDVPHVAYVSHICCNNMFQMFYLFRSYVATSIFILQVVSILI